MNRRRLSLLLVLPCAAALLFAAAASPWAQRAPASRPASREPFTARMIADALLARDFAMADLARNEIAAADADACAALGAEILACGVREAQYLLDELAPSGNPNTLIAAIVALDSEAQAVRLAAMDALQDASFEWLGKVSDDALTVSRRARLLEMLTSRDELARRAEAAAAATRDARQVHVNIQMGMLADRYFGAPGYIRLLRELTEVMLGEPLPDNMLEMPEDERGLARNRAEQDRRRRIGAATLFRDLWVEDLALFNYMPEAGYSARKTAVARIQARLDEMERLDLNLGDGRYRGVRCGDYLIALFDSDNNDVRAAAYLRLVSAAGKPVKGLDEQPPLAGEKYTSAVAVLMALSRREFAELRRELKAWWAAYRKATEPR